LGARELAEEGARAGETVVVLSGDGMIGVVADVLRHFPGALLGVLPGGRGNDLARVLGIPQDPVAACSVIADGVPRAMDLGEVGSCVEVGQKTEPVQLGTAQTVAHGQAFVGIASAGFDSVANRIANEAPASLGNFVYAYGALRALASGSAARDPHFPDLPTVAETLPGFQSEGWQMLVAPLGTPDGIVKKINADLIKALSFDDVKKRLTALGREDSPLSPAETLAFIQHEQATWAPILAQIGPVK